MEYFLTVSTEVSIFARYSWRSSSSVLYSSGSPLCFLFRLRLRFSRFPSLCLTSSSSNSLCRATYKRLLGVFQYSMSVTYKYSHNYKCHTCTENWPLSSDTGINFETRTIKSSPDMAIFGPIADKIDWVETELSGILMYTLSSVDSTTIFPEPSSAKVTKGIHFLKLLSKLLGCWCTFLFVVIGNEDSEDVEGRPRGTCHGRGVDHTLVGTDSLLLVDSLLVVSSSPQTL